jgi:hypothetical protein
MKALRGRFAVDRPPGHGTRIAFELPLTADPAGAVERMGSGPPRTPDEPLIPPAGLPPAVDAYTVVAAVGASVDALYIVDAQSG